MVFYIMYHENHIRIENFLNSYMAREPKPSGISPVYHHPRCCRCVGKTPDAFFVCEVEDRKPSKINQEDCNPLGTELKWSPTDKIWITYVCKRSLTITEIVGTSVKLKRTSRFVPDHFRRSEMSATLCLHSSQQNLGRQGKSENQIELVKIVEKLVSDILREVLGEVMYGRLRSGRRVQGSSLFLAEKCLVRG